MKRKLLLIALGALIGCHGSAKDPVSSTTQPVSTQLTLTTTPPKSSDPRDPQPPWEALVHLDVYQLEVPIGTISANETFWKRVDENCLGVARAQLLHKNGIRFGIASKKEWSFFRDLFTAQPNRVMKTDINGTQGRGVELSLTKKVEEEDLFFWNSQDLLEGHSYQACVNRVDLSFEPVTRKPWSVRVAICPTVFSQHTRLEFTPMNHEIESSFAVPSHIYDLGLEAEIDEASFMIIGPDSPAGSSTSIGSRFFIKDNNAEQTEQILLIVPSFLKMDGKPMAVSDIVRH